jgi:hypothetical protein
VEWRLGSMGRTTHWRLRAWWDGRDLVVRWSRRVGQWLEPCVLAARVKSPRAVNPDALLAVNRLGDALAVWSAKGRVPTLWARFRPAGHGWSEPIRVTRASSIPVAYTADLGDGGHAAIAWMPRNGREIHVVRTLGAAPRGRLTCKANLDLEYPSGERHTGLVDPMGERTPQAVCPAA